MSRERGIFIVFEGIDGAGTTTQARRLDERIGSEAPELGVTVTAEPSNGPVGTLIRQVLRGRVTGLAATGAALPFDRRALALLFAADRLDHVACEVEPLVAAGRIVISDRYVGSSLAYQGLDAPLEWVAAINRFAPAPDLLVFLDVPVGVAWERIRRTRAGTELFEVPETLARVAAGYPKAMPKCRSGRTVTVDGTLPPDVVAAQVWEHVRPLLRGRR